MADEKTALDNAEEWMQLPRETRGIREQQCRCKQLEKNKVLNLVNKAKATEGIYAGEGIQRAQPREARCRLVARIFLPPRLQRKTKR